MTDDEELVVGIFHHPDLHGPSEGGREEEWAESPQWAEPQQDRGVVVSRQTSAIHQMEGERRSGRGLSSGRSLSRAVAESQQWAESQQGRGRVSYP
ncbi:hypothetical protein EYF80_053266 [Liparis tanakae]|uniref:Uncharacterized protein n=1 Tax=Liparis tanakae TaxID=230148 RepID=A0A4Z2F663_9TELE|nr:hypothetical protein EYF80_053266 [Liparis tanakae]